MSYKYMLPNDAGAPIQYFTDNNSIIIIGANGSGKSKLGAWMEQQDMNNVHRIGAQRSLNFGDYIHLKSYEEAEYSLLYGDTKKTAGKIHRWGNKQYTTKLLDDYEHVLSALIAKKNNSHDEFVTKFKELNEHDKAKCLAPHTDIDELQNIWEDIFPHRLINFDDAKVTAIMKSRSSDGSENKLEYKGKEMSDGERVALYLIAQCICIMGNKTFIIDEPEIHLHRSIMNKLWTALENARPDCLFIYITHDTQFAAMHSHAKKIWVKEYDGDKWMWEMIEDSSLPEQLLLNILGNRKPVLFVEGTENSIDTTLYSELFKNFYVIPCGSCKNVINRTAAMRDNSQLHHLEAYGIIDRDYRTEKEIEKCKENGVYPIDVAEVENLFLVEEILTAVNNHLGFSDFSRIEKIKDYIKDRYKKQINRQICEAVVACIKYRLTVISVPISDESQARKALDDLLELISYDDVKREIAELFNNEKAVLDYRNLLRIFNSKSLASSVGHYFGLNNSGYCEAVIRLFKKDSHNIFDLLKPYLPPEIVSITEKM